MISNSKHSLGLKLLLTVYIFCLSNLYADEKRSLRVAKSIIASQLIVSMDSFSKHTSLAEIGEGGSQVDVINILSLTERAIRRKISDDQFKKIMGKFDRNQARRFTAAKLAKLIQQFGKGKNIIN